MVDDSFYTRVLPMFFSVGASSLVPCKSHEWLGIGCFHNSSSFQNVKLKSKLLQIVLLAVLNGTELMEAVIMIYLLRRSKPMWQDSVKKRLCFNSCDSAKIVADALISDFNEVLEAGVRRGMLIGISIKFITVCYWILSCVQVMRPNQDDKKLLTFLGMYTEFCFGFVGIICVFITATATTAAATFPFFS
ncbi:Uncharacterized protein TCM_032213 [Theobroma cacao]|uniref:Uncharacterized protein n=1 Tax=Theobroma cacao TaxID=3641 RepID=A0A061FA67_THECC|nr:Uncharacterized protein TCM_032213 [Theobroma cacao]